MLCASKDVLFFLDFFKKTTVVCLLVPVTFLSPKILYSGCLQRHNTVKFQINRAMWCCGLIAVTISICFRYCLSVSQSFTSEHSVTEARDYGGGGMQLLII